MGTLDKPIVIERVHGFIREVRNNDNKIGILPRQMIIDYNNACNFNCSFCYQANDGEYLKEHLTIDEISRLADQAYNLGIWEIILQGGELLIRYEELLSIIAALKPERFRVILVTNGYYLSYERAKELKLSGLDCIGVSISTLNPDAHNEERGSEDAHEKALEALDNAKSAGLTTWAQVIYGHHNAFSDELQEFMDYLSERDLGIFFLLAMPYGEWADNRLTAEDLKRLQEIRRKYNCVFDTWDMYDKGKTRFTGCWAGNRPFITPIGDVLPCPFINISLGNIRRQPLKEIYDYGMCIKYFSEYSPICLAAQNAKFREKFLEKLNTSMFRPGDAHQIFKKEDYIND